MDVNHADEPLSALMRGLLSELENDEDDEDEDEENDNNGKNYGDDENANIVPNSGASLDSLFAS